MRSNPVGATGAQIILNDNSDSDVDENWQNEPIGRHKLKLIDFTKRRQLLVDQPGNNEPIDYFFLLGDDQFMELIVAETNKYAEEIFLTGITEQSRMSRWKELTVAEFKVFLGLLLHMGTWRTNRLQDYWKTDALFNLKCFSDNMSRDRFLLILRCLHFDENCPNKAARDRIYKIRPLVDFFNEKMHNVYQAGKYLSLDESMVLWRGRLIFKQFIKNKRHKYGIKLYVLTESDGIVLNMHVYTGALDSLGGKGHSKKVVLNMMRNHLGCGHSLFIDNFYTGVEVAEELLQNNTYCTGTLNTIRRDIPTEVKTAKLRKGENIGKYRNGVLVGKWHDKRDVPYISTEYPHDLIEMENRRGTVLKKPLPILKYNEHMSGVDRKDQLLSYYPCERKTMKWYKKIFIHILQVMLVNSHYLYNRFSGKKMPLYDFRLAVIKQLLKDRPPLHRMDKNEHLPTKITAKSAKNETKRKKCRWCAGRKIRKDTVHECAACTTKPGLCLGNCFKLYHQYNT